MFILKSGLLIFHILRILFFKISLLNKKWWSRHKWWSTLKSAVFGSSSSCWPPLVSSSVPPLAVILTASSPGSLYRPNSITSVLSMEFERLVSVRPGRFVERSGVLPTTQFTYRKGLGTCDVLLCVFHTLKSALERRQEARTVQIDFSVAFDRVNHQRILYKLSSVFIGDSVLSILTQFLSNLSQHVMVDGSRSTLVNLYQKCHREVFGPVIVAPLHFGAFYNSGI